MVAYARSLERIVRDFIVLGLGWHMFCKTRCFIHQLPQELPGQLGWGASSSSPVPWVSPAPSLPVPGCWQLFWGSPSPEPVSISWISATPTRLRCLSSLCCGTYLNVSLILHPLPRGGIKFTEKEQMQSRAKLVITIKPRKKQSRDTQFDSLSLPFFFKLPPFFSSFYCSNSLLPVSTTSFHQGPGFFPACFLCFIYWHIQ